MPINPAFIDVDHQDDGWLPSAEDATYGADFPDSLLIPRSEWRDRIAERKKLGISLKRYNGPYVVNQSPTSTCVHCSTSVAVRVRRNIQLGVKYSIITSPLSTYCLATRRAGSGSSVPGSLEIQKEIGQLPADNPFNRKLFKHVLQECKPFIQREQLPAGFRSTSQHFRVLEWLRIASREQFGSALLNDLPIVYGRGGHSICGEDLIDDDGRRILCSYCDSYGTGRGDNGRLYDTESKWGVGGAWAPAVIVYSGDPRRPAGSDGLVLSNMELDEIWRIV
jgi:hypothetical protein